MKMTKILTVTAFGVLLTACGQQVTQVQTEGSAPAVVSTGAEHVHNVEGFGDFKHSHQGNSTENHGHTWQQIQNEINNQQ